MVKIPELFKSKKGMLTFTGIVCVIALGGVLLINGASKQSTYSIGDYKADVPSDWNKVKNNLKTEYDTDKLIKLKTRYVGNNVAVANIIGNLSSGESMCGTVSLKTDKKPYGITIEYDISPSSLSTETLENTFRNNATVMFALIDNVDEVNYKFKDGKKLKGYKFTREELQKSYNRDLREYASDLNHLNVLINSFDLKFNILRGAYSPLMSSTPGIGISPVYGGTAEKVKYSANFGTLLTWTGGRITEYGQKAELPENVPVYWSSVGDGTPANLRNISVNVQMVIKNTCVAEKQVNIKQDIKTLFYSVMSSNDIIIKNR